LISRLNNAKTRFYEKNVKKTLNKNITGYYL